LNQLAAAEGDIDKLDMDLAAADGAARANGKVTGIVGRLKLV
jgi:hypothetical protein